MSFAVSQVNADDIATNTVNVATSAVGLGTPALDNGLEFTVSRVECGATTVGDVVLDTALEQQFCLAYLTMRNVADTPRVFVDSYQLARSGRGSSFYVADAVVGRSANPNSDAPVTEVAAGTTVSRVIVFNIPRGGDLASLQLHESAFSAGVTVQIS